MKVDIAGRLKELSRPTGTEDLLKVSYPKPRLKIETRHAIWVVVIMATVLMVWFISRDQGDEPKKMSEIVQSSATEVVEKTLVVSVVGHVEHPGLITVAAGSRIADALAIAHPLEGAELLSLNQAQKLNDGMQILVPVQGTSSHPNSPGSSRVSINTATVAELIALPGVGQKTAEAIVAFREASGGFSSVEQLMEIKGIGKAKFGKLEPVVSL